MIFDKIKEIVAEELNIDPSSIKMETSFVEDLKADSLDLVQFLIALEREYEISFGDDEIQQIKTVGDVVDYIEKNKK